MHSKWLGQVTALLVLGISAKGAARVESGAMPLFFVQVPAQHSGQADFVLDSQEMSVQFREREVVYHLSGASDIAVRFLGAKPVHAEGVEPLEGEINVFAGSDARRWEHNLSTFSSIAYRSLWPGIDAVYSVDGRLKTEFQLEPGAAAGTVRWRIDGADSVDRAPDGSLVIRSGGRKLREDAPQIFEQARVTGQLRPVSGAFRLLGQNTVGIEVGPYDHANRLIFDPVIGFSTLLGGSGQAVGTAVAVDSNGNVVVAGYTTSFDLAPGAVSIGPLQRTAAFVAKLSAGGNQLMFCTYIGGTLDTRAFAVAVDRWNNIYIAGQTSAIDFPVYRAVQPAINGSQAAFAAELNPAGSQLVFSTYLGGSIAQQAYGIAVNHLGDVFVAGDTESVNFPTVRPIQAVNGGGQDAFLVKLGVSGSPILFSTYLGGSAEEHAATLAVDSTGAAIVAGWTQSSNFPVANAFQPQSGGNQDAFVTKVNPSGTSFEFSSYLGGSGGTPGLTESAAGVAVDSANNIYVGGTTSSTDFPVTTGALQTENAGGILDAFAVKLTASGRVVYSTYLGGSSADYALSIGVDVAGNAHLAGYTGSTDFPLEHSVQPALSGEYDVFVAKLNSAGSGLIYSTLFGGNLMDSANAITVDRFGTVLIAGQSNSTNFPIVNGYQTTQHGEGAAIVARIPVGWKPVVFTSASSVEWNVNNIPLAENQSFSFGNTGDIPVAGDWTNSGKQCLGSFHSGTWYLDINCDGVYDSGDRSFAFGEAGDIPIAGDWNGSGTVKAGLYRAGTFILDLSGHLSGVPTGVKDAQFAFGEATDTPVAGDWNQSGTTKVGVFRAGEWLLDTAGTFTINGPTKNYGKAGDIPFTGDWDGSGLTKAGVYRAGEFLLDYNGNWTSDAYGDMNIPMELAAQYGPVQHALVMH